MKLLEAQLCLDCNEVFKLAPEYTGTFACPSCGSRSYFPIEAWLDRFTPAQMINSAKEAEDANL